MYQHNSMYHYHSLPQNYPTDPQLAFRTALTVHSPSLEPSTDDQSDDFTFDPQFQRADLPLSQPRRRALFINEVETASNAPRVSGGSV